MKPFFPLSLLSLVTALLASYAHPSKFSVFRINSKVSELLRCFLIQITKLQGIGRNSKRASACTRRITGNALLTALKRKEKKEKRNSGNRSRPLLCELLTFSTSQWEPPPHTISNHFIKNMGEKTAKREL